MRYERIVFRKTPFAVCTVDLARDDLRLFWKSPQTGKRFGSLGALAHWTMAHHERLEFATNAGIFAPGYTPLGLYLEAGRILIPLNSANGAGNFFLKPNGVFAVGAARAAIVPTASYSKLSWPVRFATQSGPLLARNGKPHPAFREASLNLTIRSGVGIQSASRVAFAISDGPVNFIDFARLFLDRLACRDALYLDGGISRMYCRSAGRQDQGGDFAALIGVLAPGKGTGSDHAH